MESSTDGQNDLAVLAHLPVPAHSVSLAISGLLKQEPLVSKGAISPLAFSASGGISRTLVGSFRSAFVEDAVQASSNPTGDRRCPAMPLTPGVRANLRSWGMSATQGNTRMHTLATRGSVSSEEHRRCAVARATVSTRPLLAHDVPH